MLVDWCPEPPQGEGVTVVVSGKRAGSTATYNCQPGFILFGQQVNTPVISVLSRNYLLFIFIKLYILYMQLLYYYFINYQ